MICGLTTSLIQFYMSDSNIVFIIQVRMFFYIVLILANVGIHDRFSKAHGCWTSKIAKNMYITPSLKHQLQVTRGLGLDPNDTCTNS